MTTITETQANVARAPSASRILAVSGFGLLFDSMDVGLLAFVLTSIARQWSLGPSMMGFLGSVGFIGMAIGSAVSGLMADRYGRKRIFMFTLVIYSLATGLTALSNGVLIFIILRLLVGFGLGGELPVATTYVLESSTEATRGRRVVFLETFWAFGSLVAAVISRLVMPAMPQGGWRIVFLIGAIPALYVLVLRSALPETPIYRSLTQRPKIRAAFATLWHRELVKSTVVTWILWFVMNFGYYGMFLWLPSIMSLKGYSLVNSIGYVLIMTTAQIPGYLTAAWLVEKWGRKRTLVPAIFLTALSALGFGLAHGTIWLVIFGLLLNYFMLAAFAGTYIFTVEQFPTAARASGIGWAAGFGRVGGIIAPFLVGAMVARGIGFNWIFGLFFGITIVGFLVVTLFGRETKGQTLT